MNSIKPKDVNSEVLYNEQLSKNYFRLGLKTCWKKFDPGQFVMVRVPGNAVFLRRPFSILKKIDSQGIEIFYKVVGVGTHELSKVSSGEKIGVVGPLGKGFSIPKGLEKAFLVAGGFGIAPLLSLAEQLKRAKVSMDLYYGGKGLEDIQFLDEFHENGINFHISTDDGSLGHKGMVTEILERELPKAMTDKDKCRSNPSAIIYCCGPAGLTKAIIEMARKYGLPAQLSYETYMGCGIGVCLGCAVKTKEGYKRACKDGPVFNLEELEE